MAKHRGHITGWLWVLPSVAIPLVVAGLAWTSHVASEGETIAPNVRFAGLNVSGMTVERAKEHVAWRETAFDETPVTIDLGNPTVTMTAAEIGFDYLHTDTLGSLIGARHDATPWGEFASWAMTPFRSVNVEDAYRLDSDLARVRLSHDDFVLEHPVEPRLAYGEGKVTIVPGADGTGVDIDELIAQLERADVAEGPVEVKAKTMPIPPEVDDDEAQAVATRVNELTETNIIAEVEGVRRLIRPSRIRRHISGEVLDGEMTFAIDVDSFRADVEALFPGPRGEMRKPTLEVVDGEVRVIAEGVPHQECCSLESVQAAADAVLAGSASRHELETRVSNDERLVAWAMGTDVTEAIAEFTTHHACCENRVTNIQTMADAVRGYYLIPGETLSFNEYIGPRTREKGYVPAGAIRGGYMTDEVGGGVSQFVTTMFNAAFFGGLDLDEYQSHSVYFSRYPFGREATLSIPGPDLVITNSTDYPVLIWPTYDTTSITVTLYSTEHLSVTELDQRVTYRGQCRHSEIDRERVYPDGTVVVDTIEANYRPGEGIDCNGNEIPRRD